MSISYSVVCDPHYKTRACNPKLRLACSSRSFTLVKSVVAERAWYPRLGRTGSIKSLRRLTS
jgi:hypothetical protein